MKKNLLFVMPSLSAGGGEKSLANLLTQIDYARYNVDLFLFNHDGLFMEFLPEEVKLLPLTDIYRSFALPLAQSLQQFIRNKQLTLAYNRVRFALMNLRRNSVAANEQYSWKFIARALETLPGSYDAAIGFLEKTSTYFCVDKVKAAVKIGWVHIDYDSLGMDPDFDIRYFGKLDHIVTVSEECASILKERFPMHQHKVNVIYNIVSPRMVQQLADQVKEDVYARKEGEIIILSIGRLHPQKNFELAIHTCKRLVDQGYAIRWCIVGEGEEREKLTKLIAETRMENHVQLLGLRANPYPYIKQADIYVQTSRFEGKSIAIDEAKILRKPIVVTNFSTVTDQIHNGKNGLVVGMDADAVATGIAKLIRDRQLGDGMVRSLHAERLGTEEEIYKLYALLGDSCEEETIIRDE